MESNKLPLENNISQKENNLIYNTSIPDNYQNIETTESSNLPSHNIPNNFSLSSKLSNLIKKTNSSPLNLKNLFNKWKNITFFNEKHLLKKSRKILIKKTFNIRRPKGNEEVLDKERKKIKILKKFKPINLNEDSEKRKKIINFFEERIMAYISKKDILRKYYNIWLSKINNNEIISNRKITKKTISIIKFKDNKEDKKENLLNEKEEKIKNIIDYNESLNKYFNIWKNISKVKENEINENTSPIKVIKKENPSKRLKIVKKIITKNPKKLNEKRKKKLTKIIVSKNTTTQDNTEFLRKYFNKWVSIGNNEDDGNIIQEDKQIKMIIGNEDNAININKIEDLKETKDSWIDVDKKESSNSNEKKNKEKRIISKVIIKKNIIKNTKKSKVQNKDENIQPKESRDNINLEENIEYVINSPMREENVKEVKPKEQNDNELISKERKLEISNGEFLQDEPLKNEEDNEKEVQNLENPNEKYKLEKLIKIGNPIKNYFNKWKMYSQTKQKQKENEATIINVVTEKIVTKKKVLSIKKKVEQKEKEESPIYIIKKGMDQPLIKQDSNKKAKAKLKIIEVIKKRIASYLSTKQLLKKYYNIWLSKVPPDIVKESVVNKIINKKVLSFKKRNKNTVNDKSTINQVKKNLFSSDKETEIEKNIKLEIFKKKDNEKVDGNFDLFEDINIDKIQDEEITHEKTENDVFRNNIMRLSQKLKNNGEKKDINNNIITEQKEEIILNNNNNKIFENETELNSLENSEKDKKLKNIVNNKNHLIYYFKRWIKIIYLNKNKKGQTENISEIKDDDENKKNEEFKNIFLKTLETLDNIYNKILKKKYFILLKIKKGKHEIENETNLDLNKKEINIINEGDKNIETVKVEKKEIKDEVKLPNKEILNESNEQKIKDDKIKCIKEKEESNEPNKSKIIRDKKIRIDEKNSTDNQINHNIENEQYKNIPKVDTKNEKISDESIKNIIISEITNKSNNEKDNNNLKIPFNDNYYSTKVKNIETEKELDNQKKINFQEINEPEKKEIKGRIDVIKLENDIDNNIKQNDKLAPIKNIELENKNDDESKNVRDKRLNKPKKDEIKNKNLNDNKDIDIEDSEKQIKSQEKNENDENIIINNEDNNKKEQSEEEIKEDLKLDDEIKNNHKIEEQKNNKLNNEKFVQNIVIKENDIDDKLSKKENDNISNNHKEINNSKKYKFVKKIKTPKTTKENSNEYIDKESKENCNELKQTNFNENFEMPESENNIEKFKNEIININLNEDLTNESNSKKIKVEKSKILKEKEESDELNKQKKIIGNEKNPIDNQINQNIDNEKLKNISHIDKEKEKISDNYQKFNEPEKEKLKEKINEQKLENDINQENVNNFNLKENDNIEPIKDTEYKIKKEEPDNIGDKILKISTEKDEIDNKDKNSNKNKNNEDSNKQIKSPKKIKSYENIISKEDNNKKEKQPEEEIKEEKNLVKTEKQNNNQLNNEKLEQNEEIKVNNINDILFEEEKNKKSNNHIRIDNNNQQLSIENNFKESEIQKENSNIDKNIKEKSNEIKQPNIKDNLEKLESENNSEKYKNEMKNINLNEDILNESNEQKIKMDKDKILKEKEEPEEFNKTKIIQSKKIINNEKNSVDNQISQNIKNEKLNNVEKVDIEKENISDYLINYINVIETETTNESKNKKNNNNIKLPINENNNHTKVNVIKNEIELINQKKTNFQEIKEPEKEEIKEKAEEIKMEKDINQENINKSNNNIKENESIEPMTNIELENKNEESKNIEEKTLKTFIERDESGKNKYLKNNKDIDTKDSDKQTKTTEKTKKDENIIINNKKDNNNNNEQPEEEMKEELKFNNTKNNLSRNEEQKNNQSNEKLEQNIEIKVNDIDDKLSKEEKEQMPNNYIGINNKEKLQNEKNLNESEIKQENSYEYIDKESKDKSIEIKRDNSKKQIQMTKSENNFEKFKNDINVNLNEDILNESNEQNVKDDNNKILKEKEEPEKLNKLKIIQNKKIIQNEKSPIDNRINQNIKNEKIINLPKDETVKDNSIKDINVLESKTNEFIKEKNNEYSEIPINDNNDLDKNKIIDNVNEEALNNKKKEINEPEKDNIKDEGKLENDINIENMNNLNNNIKINDIEEAIKNIELENKNKEPENVEDKRLKVSMEKYEIDNENLNDNKDNEDLDKQINSIEIFENDKKDENININNKEDNNKKELYEEEVKEEFKFDNNVKNLDKTKEHEINVSNNEKPIQIEDMKRNDINDKLSKEEKDKILNNHKEINNIEKLQTEKKLNESVLKKEISDEYLNKERKEKSKRIKQPKVNENLDMTESDNNPEKLEGEIKNINLNEDILNKSNKQKVKDDNNKTLKEKEELEDSNKLEIIENKKITNNVKDSIDNKMNQNIENEKPKNTAKIEPEKEKIIDNSRKDINALESKKINQQRKEKNDEKSKTHPKDNNNLTINKENEETLNKQKKLNNQNINEPEEEKLQLKDENYINKDNVINSNNNIKEEDKLEPVKNIELKNKNEESENIGDKLVYISKEKDETDNENKYLNKKKDIEELDEQIKSKEKIERDENIIVVDKEDNNIINNKTDKSEEEIKKEIKMDNSMKNLSEIEEQIINESNNEKFEQNVDIRVNDIDDKLSKEEKEKMPNNEEGINNIEKLYIENESKEQEIKKDNPDNYINKERKEKSDNIKQPIIKENLTILQQENISEKSEKNLNEDITFLKDDIKKKELEDDKNEDINKLNDLKDNILKENVNYENKVRKREGKPEKIGIIETYSIDDIDESENDNQKDKSKEFKVKEKYHINIINKQIINTLDSANSESIEKEKEETFDIKYIYSKPKNDIKQDILEENTKENIYENQDEYNLNKEDEKNKLVEIKDKLTLSEKNKQLENYINEYMTKDKDYYNDKDKDENNELNYNQKNINEEKYMNEKNIPNYKLIRRVDINQQKIQNKLLQLIKIKNPLHKYFKKWKQILYTSEIQVALKNKREIEKINNINDEKNEKIYDEEDFDLHKKDENKNRIYSPNKNIKGDNKQKKVFIHNVRRRIKLKNIIIKYISNLPKKHELYYYFNDWKNKTNDQMQFDTINRRNNQKTYITTRRRFIPGKKILPFEKLEKLNQIDNQQSPRSLNNIITKNENKQKKKILTKLVIKKAEKESIHPLKRYLNIWKQNIKIDKDENEDKNIDNIDNEIINIKEKYTITYKRRKIKEKYDTEVRNNNDKVGVENKNNLYRKHRISNSNIMSPINNNHDDKIKSKEEELKDNNFDNNCENNINIKEIIKKFVLPMPKKEEVKECPLIISPVGIKEEFDELNLDMDKLDIKNTPKKPNIKFSKKNNNNIYKLINHRYNTDIGLLGQNKNKNKIITNTNINYKDNNSENDEEKENTADIQIIQKVINVTTDSEEPNTITLKNDPSIENNDFGHKSKHITYKKIIKTIKNISKNDNEKNIGRNIDKTLYTYDSRHVKAKTFISENVGKNEDINKIKKFNLGNKICKKEYIINYDDLILCEEIIYKCNDPVNEKILNIKPVQKPKKIEKNNKYKSPIISPIYDEKKESIFVQKVIRYKKQEKKYGYGNIDKSPMRLPINPNDIELQISALSPFNRSSRDFYKKEIKKLNKLEEISPPQDMCITDRGNKKDTLLIFNSPKMNNSDENNNNNIFDNTYSDNYENEINDPELNNNINKELNLTKKLADFHLRFFKDLPEKSFYRIQPRILYNIINKGNEKLALLKIFYIYEKYKMNEYSIKKMYLRKWQRALNFLDINIDNNIHIINKFGHCLSAKNIVIREIRCGIHQNNENNFNCSCLRIRIKLKKILIRHHLLKDIDPRKYYLFKWYKNTFRKIRAIFVISN